MNEKIEDSERGRLVNKFRDLLVQSIVRDSEVKKREISGDSNRKLLMEELIDFIDKDGNAKQWLRARCLESIVASAGLNEYLETLLIFRGSSPSRIAPLNLMFASSQIARALDPIVIRLLKELHRKKKLIISEQELDALIKILSPDLNFSVTKSEVYFDVDEVERLRNLLLEFALEDLVSVRSKDARRLAYKYPKLKRIGKAPDISLRKLISVSRDYANLDISLNKGVLRWRYGTEPTIFVRNGTCFYDQLEVDSKGISYDSVRRQFHLMRKKVETGKTKTTRKTQSRSGIENAQHKRMG